MNTGNFSVATLTHGVRKTNKHLKFKLEVFVCRRRKVGDNYTPKLKYLVLASTYPVEKLRFHGTSSPLSSAARHTETFVRRVGSRGLAPKKKFDDQMPCAGD